MELDYSLLVVSVCLLFLVFSLIFEWFKTPITFLIVISTICITGVMTPQEALNQIANEQIVLVVMLMVIGNILRRSELVELLFKRIFKDGISEKQFVSRQYIFAGGLSAFFNNTPLVAILIPQISEWCTRNNVSPTRLLMPLSFASIIGGGITLIGTSTNLIVDKLYRDAGGVGFSLFDFSIIGLPLFLVGFLYTLIFRKVLRTRLRPVRNIKSDDYLVETRLKQNSVIIGKSIESAGLRNLENLFIVEIIRSNEVVRPVSPQEIIQEGDKIIFAGDTSKIIQLMDKHPSIELNNTSVEIKNKQNVVEAIVPFNSSLVGSKINQTNFRSRFDAAIIGVRRNGERLYGKIGELVVKKGDMFLCVTGKDFENKVDRSSDLYVVSEVHTVKNINKKSSLVVLFSLASAMILSGLKIMDLFSSMLLMLTVIAISGLVKFSELRKSFNYNFLLIGGGALVLGKSMIDSGLAEIIASNSLFFFSSLGITASLIGVFLITNLLASVMTNVGAVAIVYPVAFLVARDLNIDLFYMSMMVAFGGSKIFLTAVGYQTNLMVQGPGGYKGVDYLKFGGGILLVLTITLWLLVKTVI